MYTSVNILNYLFRRIKEHVGVLYKTAHHLKCTRVIESVANSLVRYYGDVHNGAYLHRSVVLYVRFLALCAVGKEDGEITEIVKMMVNGRDTEASHTRYYKRAVEWADREKKLGKGELVIQKFQYANGKAQKEAREVGKHLCGLVKIAVGLEICVFLDYLVELFIDVNNGIGRLEIAFYNGIGAVKRKLLFYRHNDLYIISCKNALSGNKAVNSRALRNGANVSGKKNMQHAHIDVTGSLLLTQKLFAGGYIYSFGKKILCIVTRFHNKGRNHSHGRDRA